MVSSTRLPRLQRIPLTIHYKGLWKRSNCQYTLFCAPCCCGGLLLVSRLHSLRFSVHALPKLYIGGLLRISIIL